MGKMVEHRPPEGEYFHRLFAGCPFGIVLSDRDVRIIRVNPAFLVMLGYAESELLGRSVDEITHPDDRAASWQLLTQLDRRELPHFQTVKRYLRKDQGVVYGRLTALAIHDEDGAFLYGLGIVEDITELQRQDAELRRAREQELASRIDQARLEGVLLTVRLAVDRLGNALTSAYGFTDLVLGQNDLPRQSRAMLNQATAGFQDAVQFLADIQTVVRVAIVETPNGPELDLVPATPPRPH